MTALEVVQCGPMTTLQDAGRFGWQRHGVSSSGAMDGLALAAANVLVGNAADSAAIELAVAGGIFAAAEGDIRFAVAGAAPSVTIDGRAVGDMRSAVLPAGERLHIGPARSGVFSYLAVAGGFALQPVLGSVSFHSRALIGGFGNRPLQAGDRLPLLSLAPARQGDLALPPPWSDDGGPISVVLGPQDDYFSEDGIRTFLGSDYRVSAQADRMGYRLAGPAIAHRRGFNIISDGIVPGSVQVPGDGAPIVLLADRQTTGGYPKIATVITPDLRRIAQLRTGDAVRFTAIPIAEAQQTARAYARIIAELATRTAPLAPSTPDSEALLAANLAGRALNALDDITW